MIEVAVRVSELVSSNVNAMVDSASNPVKMVKLLILEIEDAILTLRRESSQAERKVRDLRLLADRHAMAQADWAEKARFAMSKDREDLARGALVERENSAAAAAAARSDADAVEAGIAEVRTTLAALEARLGEARQRQRVAERTQPKQAAAAPARGTSAYSERVMDRIDTLQGRIDFADAAMPSAKAVSLEEELAALAQDAKLDSELDALRKSVKKKRA
jgi:phage shock protein A